MAVSNCRITDLHVYRRWSKWLDPGVGECLCRVLLVLLDHLLRIPVVRV